MRYLFFIISVVMVITMIILMQFYPTPTPVRIIASIIGGAWIGSEWTSKP